MTDRLDTDARERGVRRLATTAMNGAVVDLVPGGKCSYLWISADGGRNVATVSGEKTLRKLAHAILEELGEGGGA